MDLEAVLAARKAQYKSTEVQKDVDLQYDLGNVLATDLNPLDGQAMKYEKHRLYQLYTMGYFMPYITGVEKTNT